MRTSNGEPTDFNNDLVIDQHALDQEWLRQPMLYQFHAERTAELRRMLDLAKEAVTDMEAELDREIRDSAGDSKITEKAIAQKIALNPKLRQAKTDMLDVKFDLDKATGMLTSLDHRRRALENLVELHGRDYFSTPREPKSVKGENFERKAVSKTANEKIKKRREQRERDED